MALEVARRKRVTTLLVANSPKEVARWWHSRPADRFKRHAANGRVGQWNTASPWSRLAPDLYLAHVGGSSASDSRCGSDAGL